jgi:SAM-dependent methyltransferase
MSLGITSRLKDYVANVHGVLDPARTKQCGGFRRLEGVINRTISPNDALYPVYKKARNERQYFLSGLRQLKSFDAMLQEYCGKRLTECESIVDFACHYGRVLRCLRAALSKGKLYACDIDREAVDFCVREFDCLPLYESWNVEETVPVEQHEFLFCVSLLTHTRKDYFSRVLKRWEEMLSPGGLLLFTFLGEGFTDKWVAGELDHYVSTPIDRSAMQERIVQFRESGHTFYGYPSPYSQSGEYGIGFLSTELIQRELCNHSGFQLQAFVPAAKNNFGQDLAVVRRI